eukprot:COSAG02_NODE_20466_length_830_cov_1.406293_1_plen_114_part_00
MATTYGYDESDRMDEMQSVFGALKAAFPKVKTFVSQARPAPVHPRGMDASQLFDWFCTDDCSHVWAPERLEETDDSMLRHVPRSELQERIDWFTGEQQPDVSPDLGCSRCKHH